MSEVSGYATFVVRVAHDEAGQLTGVVEQVRTGEKARVTDLAGISAIIARWLADAQASDVPDVASGWAPPEHGGDTRVRRPGSRRIEAGPDTTAQWRDTR